MEFDKTFLFGIIFGIIVLFLFDKFSDNCWISNSHYNDKKAIVKTLIRQSARWSTAAEQDQNSMIAVLHANYGAAYLWAVNDIATSSEIEQMTGINYAKFMSNITNIQDKATKNMIALCPQYAPSKSELTKIAGEG